jgi:hypothetical protein
MQATTSYLPGSQRSVKWAPEMLVLFWETLQCNKRFRSFIIDSNRSHDFLVLCIFYAMEYKSDASKQGVVRMCIFILQTMSAEPTFGKSLNNAFEAQETLPQSIRLLKFRGSYGDFLIMVGLFPPIEMITPNTNCSSLFTLCSPPAKETWIPYILPF